MKWLQFVNRIIQQYEGPVIKMNLHFWFIKFANWFEMILKEEGGLAVQSDRRVMPQTYDAIWWEVEYGTFTLRYNQRCNILTFRSFPELNVGKTTFLTPLQWLSFRKIRHFCIGWLIGVSPWKFFFFQMNKHNNMQIAGRSVYRLESEIYSELTPRWNHKSTFPHDLTTNWSLVKEISRYKVD